ncbi:MAG: hypothetical protein CUN49_10770 [Candidatus Thermofonsia Clade 1 bacterium]|jgi:hypothetical protein|uniref:Uncharacterized protein n=1 Tax=Candidatus Thermofonsia Clade 1 bacterium TaxID=2364210 RepID=A0A2M8PCW5_9CHLR|nr:MAG: hypothetical protein CUN49_10770 [Candidatus Thermofonsia Clade 1 bacterium]RMF48950.1 MAG: hypothetical protein D6749_14375 [Chloroflexota bacterium]
MGRFLALLVATSLLFSALINAARAAGSAQPLPIDQFFTHLDGSPCQLPCLLGVQPSQTLFMDANRLVRQHPLMRGQLLTERVNGNLVELIGVDITVVLLRGRRNELALISVHSEPFNTVIVPAERFSHTYTPISSLGTLGDVLVRFGTPAHVLVPRRSANMVRLFYPEQGMVITGQLGGASSGTHMRTSDQVQYIGISAADWYRDSWQGLTFSATTWHGFSRAMRYLQTSRSP